MQLLRQRPECTVRLVQAGEVETMRSLMANKDVDMALFTPIRLEPATVDAEIICHERPVLIAPHGFPVRFAANSRGRRRVRIAQIGEMPFILPTTNQYYDRMILHTMNAAGVRLKMVMQSCDAALTLHLVLKGMGVTILPDTFIVGDGASDLDVYGIDGMDGARELYLLQRANWVRTPDAEALVRSVREQVARFSEIE